MNYYQIGEQTMSIFKNMFSSAEKVTVSAIGGLLSLYSPVYVPILALAGIIIVDSLYECKANKKQSKYHNVIEQSRRLYSKVFYKLRDSIVAICGAFTIETFIITSASIPAVEFVAGAIALVEFFQLLENLGKIHPNWKIWGILQKIIEKKGEQILDVSLDKEFSDDTNNTKHN